MKVFILEDDPARMTLFHEALAKHDVTHREHVKDAIDAYAPLYDLLLLDHDLGGEHYVPSELEDTGAGFCRWLVKSKQQQAPVYIHSYNRPGAVKMAQILLAEKWHVGLEPFGPQLLTALARYEP